MNPGLTDDHVSIRYYDSDYPSANGTRYPENFDPVTEYQGLAHDVDRYREIAAETGGPILELCCGTGRVAIPLARDGHDVDGIDIMPSMLEALRGHVADEPPEVQERIRGLAGDARSFDLDRSYALVIVAFNSLLCIPDFESQCQVLERIAAHLLPEGRLVLDVVNPLQLSLKGDPVPKPFFTRRLPSNGNVYTRFAMADPFDEQHRQRLHGWYDEIRADGAIERRPYSMVWRPIFRHEMQHMLARAGLTIACLEGGHREERYEATSPRMFLQAKLRGEDAAAQASTGRIRIADSDAEQ